MKFRNRETTEILTREQLREALHNVYLPDEPTAEYMDGLGYDIVQSVSQAWLIFDKSTSYASLEGAEQVNGQWQDKWVIKPLPASVIAERLAAAKVAKLNQINAWRKEANASYFMHQGKKIAVDETSTKDIASTAGYIGFFGTLPPDWPGGWKAMDNSYIAITTIEGFRSMYASMVGQGTTNFMRSQALKAQVEAATTLNQINAITWS